MTDSTSPYRDPEQVIAEHLAANTRHAAAQDALKTARKRRNGQGVALAAVRDACRAALEADLAVRGVR